MPEANLQKLQFSDSTDFLTQALQSTPNLTPEHIEANEARPNPATYFINKEKKQIIFVTPLFAEQLSVYLSTLQEKLAEESLDDYSLILSMIGRGVTEQHLVTLYKPKGCENDAFVIDSKTSDPKFFFDSLNENESSSNSHGALHRVLNKVSHALKKAFRPLKGAFRALIPNYQHTLQPTKFYFASMRYLSTGNQSYFDGISCGYHTLSTIQKLIWIIDSDKAVPSPQERRSSKALRSLLDSSSNHSLIREKIPDAFDKKKQVPPFRHYAASAWNKTFFNGVNESTRQKQKFQHLVLGWPLEDRLALKIIYFLSLTFVLHPLKLLLNLIITLPINLLTATLQFWKDNVFLAETNISMAQYARSAFLLITYPCLGLSKMLSFMTTRLFSILTPFEKRSETIESEPPTKRIPPKEQEDESEDESFDYVSLEEDSPISEASASKQHATNPRSVNNSSQSTATNKYSFFGDHAAPIPHQRESPRDQGIDPEQNSVYTPG